MMIKSTKTLILLGAVAFSVTACDGQEPQKAASTAEQGDAQEEIKVFRNAGELAICLSNCSDNHCALAMGGCLRATAECGGKEGCEDSYNSCAEQLIAPACAVKDKKVELAGALGCWNTFQGCLADSNDSRTCVGDLYVCAQEGCDEEGCEDVAFSADNVWPEPEKFDPEGRP